MPTPVPFVGISYLSLTLAAFAMSPCPKTPLQSLDLFWSRGEKRFSLLNLNFSCFAVAKRFRVASFSFRPLRSFLCKKTRARHYHLPQKTAEGHGSIHITRGGDFFTVLKLQCCVFRREFYLIVLYIMMLLCAFVS